MHSLPPSSLTVRLPEASGTEAFATNPEEQGAVVAVVSLRDHDGSRAIVTIALLLDGPVQHAVLKRYATPAYLDLVLGSIPPNKGVRFTAAPPGEVVQVLDEAIARTLARGNPVPASVAAAMRVLTAIPRTPAPPIVPRATVSFPTVAALLARPLHQTWGFPIPDMARFGVKRPPFGPQTVEAQEEWIADALRTLENSPMRGRVVAMVRYMSKWASWRGEPGEAAEWITIANEVERAFAESPVAAMLMRKTVVNTMSASSGGKGGTSPVGHVAPFAYPFPEEASRTTRTVVIEPTPEAAKYELIEYYCNDPACDCQLALLRVVTSEKQEFVANLAYRVNATAEQEQVILVVPEEGSPLANALLATVRDLVRTDLTLAQQFAEHYAMVKRSVPAVAAVPSRPKVGPNEACPCGSGKKYKKCCRD